MPVRSGDFAPAGKLHAAEGVAGTVRVAGIRGIGDRLQEAGRIGLEDCRQHQGLAGGRLGVVADKLRTAAVLPAGRDAAVVAGRQFDRIVAPSFAVAQNIKRQPEGFFVERAWHAVFDDGVAAVGLHDEPLLAAGETDGRAGAAAVCLGPAKHGA